MINTNLSEPVKEASNSIRPGTMDGYIGQTKIKENLKIAIKAAKMRGETIDHILFYGPPGLGKTTISYIVANEMDANIKVTSGPAIEKPGELAAILSSLCEHDILFIDEIHRLSKPVEEVLYSAMEDFNISITIGQGEQVRTMTLDLPHFTLIGATTRAGMLSAPLRDRFGLICRMEYYSNTDLRKIILQSAKKLNVEIPNDICEAIADVSRGTPRIANNLLKRARDYIQMLPPERCNAPDFLSFMNIQANGLSDMDMGYLSLLEGTFNNKPTGIQTIAAALGEDIETLETVCEPYLIQKGFLIKTPRGRMLTDAYLQSAKPCKKGA